MAPRGYGAGGHDEESVPLGGGGGGGGGGKADSGGGGKAAPDGRGAGRPAHALLQQVAALAALASLAVGLALLLPQSAGAAFAARAPAGAGGPAGATATSGSLFSGEPRRAFAGPRLLADPSPPAAAAAAAPDGAGGPAGSRNWAVVTTIFEPSDAIRRIAKLSGWSMVVVGDEGGAAFNFTAPGVVFLDAGAQRRLGEAYSGFVDLLPWRHFGRKNVGFLYAISRGAEVIWDFDDDNIMNAEGLAPRVPADEVYDIAAPKDCEVFNPYPWMGGPGGAPNGTGAAAPQPGGGAAPIPPAWPRGFPLERLRDPCAVTLSKSASTDRIAVVQSLADHDPDVDGIYRLTRGTPFDFGKAARRTLVLPEGLLAPWNAQAALVLRPAFFALLLPVTVHGRVSDIWRSYVAQRVLWDAGYRLAFSPPQVVQHRNPHNYLADMQAEHDLYFRSGALAKLLRSWCSPLVSIEGRLEDLIIQMYERGYLEIKDVHLTQQWLLALRAAGYAFPALTAAAASNCAAGGSAAAP